MNDLLLMTIGRRDHEAKVGFLDAASYWSSSPTTSAKTAYGVYINRTESTDSKAIQISNIEGRVRARSVRCKKIIENTIKHIFIPINLLIYSTPIGVLINKLKDNIIKKEKFNKSIIIITLIFVIVLIFETNYISSFYRGVLNV